VARGPCQWIGCLDPCCHVGLVGPHRLGAADPQSAATGVEPGSAPVSWRPGCRLHRCTPGRFGARHLCAFWSHRAVCPARVDLEAWAGCLGRCVDLSADGHLCLVASHAPLTPPALEGGAQHKFHPLGVGYRPRVVGRHRRGKPGRSLVRNRSGIRCSCCGIATACRPQVAGGSTGVSVGRRGRRPHSIRRRGTSSPGDRAGADRSGSAEK
jgi:hypothetical protein